MQFAVTVMLIPTVGDVLLAEMVHAGADGAAGFQLTLTLACMLLPPLLTAVTEYDAVPGVAAVATQLAEELEQPTQV